jgi:ADP-ribose pyrophosphatase
MPKIVHKNRLFKVEESTVTVKNKKFKNHKIIEDDTVVVLPITRKGYILLEEQYRPALKSKMFEIPSGHVDKGENLHDAARRELEEETGFKAGKLTFMTFFYSAPGIVSKRENLFIAENLTTGKTSFDFDEDITVKEISIDDCIEMVRLNEIIDAKTIIALLYYKQIMNKKKLQVR